MKVFLICFCLFAFAKGRNFPRPSALLDLVLIRNNNQVPPITENRTAFFSRSNNYAIGSDVIFDQYFMTGHNSALFEIIESFWGSNQYDHWTISFFIRINQIDSVGLFELWDPNFSAGCFFCASLIENQNGLIFELKWMLVDSTYRTDSFPISQTGIYFFAVSVDPFSYSVYYYKDQGGYTTPSLAINGYTGYRKSFSSSTQAITFGRNKKDDNPPLLLSTWVNVACIAVYKQRLTTMEIKDIYDRCRQGGMVGESQYALNYTENLRFFSSMHSFNSTSFTDNAFYLPMIDINEETVIPQCESGQCVLDSQPLSDNNTSLGFPAIEVPEGLSAGNYIPITKPTSLFTIAFYLRIKPNTTIEPGNHNVFVLFDSPSETSSTPRMTFSYDELGRAHLNIFNGTTNTNVISGFQLMEDNYFLITNVPDGIVVHKIDFNGDQHQMVYFNNGKTFNSLQKGAILKLGGENFENVGIWPNVMACTFLFDTMITNPAEITPWLNFCKDWVGTDNVIMSTSPTTSVTATTSTVTASTTPVEPSTEVIATETSPVIESTSTIEPSTGAVTTTLSFTATSSETNSGVSTSLGATSTDTSTMSTTPTTTTTTTPAFTPNSDGTPSESKAPVWEVIPRVEISSTEVIPVDQVQQLCHDFDAKRSVPPNRNQTNKLELFFQVKTLHNVDTVGEKISLGGLMLLHWKVDTCSINDATIFSQFGYQELYMATPEEVWIPKLKFISSADSNIYMKGDHVGYDFLVQSSQQGENQVLDFWYLIYGKFDSTCSMELTKFPLDQQKCTLEFQTTVPRALLQVDKEKLYFSWAAPANNEWKAETKLMKSRVHPIGFGGRDVEKIEFDIVVSRVPDYYILYLAVPVFILGLVVLSSFFLPANDSNRPILSVTVLLAMYFAQNEVLSRLPVTKGDVLLGSYVLQMAIFTAAIAIVQLFVLFVATSFIFDKKACGNKFGIIRLLDFIIGLVALGGFGTINALTITKVKFPF